MRTLAALLLVVLPVFAGCGEDTETPASEPDSATTTASAEPSPSTSRSGGGGDRDRPPKVIGTVARNLAVPWGIGFLPDGSALVTERDSGRLLHLTGDPAEGMHVGEVGSFDSTATSGGESGLLGLAVSPTFAQDRRIFVYLTTAEDNRIVRAELHRGGLTDQRPILTGIPRGPIHDGGRLRFGPDGNLYASTGETGVGELAQDRSSPAGKILRITQDGDPAPGNPDPDSPVWTLGHRNVQGLDFDPDRRLWASEFGAQTWDELNLISKGENYGWPQAEGRSSLEQFVNPRVVWRTDEASPSGLAYADGSLWLGALHGARLWEVPLNGDRTGEPKDWFVGDYGRMRTVVRAPDGNLWVTTSNRDGRGSPAEQDDRILLVRP